MAVNARTEEFQHIEVFDKPALFTNGRIARDTVPKGWYCYDIRGSDDDPGALCYMEENVVVNHAGSVLMPEKLAMPTVLSRLNAFLDSELEQVLCFDSAIDAEKFGSEKSAIFLILPEEDTTKNFMAGLMIQNLSRELFAVADENGGKLQNRVVLFCDEFGTMPPFDVLPLFSAGRSRRLTLVPIIQSLAQLEKNYGKEGSEIIQDNCQDTIFGGFAPNSQTAEVLSKALGNRTVLSGSVSRGKNDPSQSLQMMERPLLTPDELKSIPKGNFIVQKTGQHPMRTRLRLFLEWGITFEKPYIVPERADRAVAYANREDLERNLPQSSKAEDADVSGAYAVSRRGGMSHEPAVDYVITHCAPTSIALMENRHNEADSLTDFLQEVKERAHYHYWLFGHYHDNRAIDEKHILLWEQIVQVI